jgi:hypothetical protein
MTGKTLFIEQSSEAFWWVILALALPVSVSCTQGDVPQDVLQHILPFFLLIFSNSAFNSASLYCICAAFLEFFDDFLKVYKRLELEP